MVALSVFLLLSLSQQQSLEGGNQDIGKTISFQAHSYNDMRLWTQIFRKGVDHIKIDPNFRPASECAQQIHVYNKSDERGCFILNHDNPTEDVHRIDYNTTDELFTILKNSSHPLNHFFTQKNKRISVALCFKNIPVAVCLPSKEAKNWLSLVDELVATYLQVIQSNPDLNVEFILDSGVPEACFVQRWRPLVSTSSPFKEAFDSNDKALGYDRWQVMNPSWKTMAEEYAAQKWGKFVNSTYAFQIWEPCNQEDLLSASELYVNVGIKHDPGLKFAINIDVAMAEVYVSNISTRGLNSLLEANAYNVASVIVSTEAGENLLLYLHCTDENPHDVFYSFREVAQNTSSVQRGQLPQWAGGCNITLSKSGSYVLAHSNKSTALYKLAGTHLNFIQNISLETNVSSMSVKLAENAQAVFFSVAIDNDNDIRIEEYVLEAGGLSLVQMWQIKTTFVLRAPAFAAFSSSNTSWGMLVMAESESNTSLVGAYLHFEEGKLTINGQLFNSTMIYSLPVLDVGNDVSITTVVSATSPEEIYFLESHANGFCQNNEKRNKQAGVSSCEQERSSSFGPLIYSIASLTQWKSFFMNSGAKLSSCDPEILHGTFSQGNAPCISGYINNSQLSIVVTHSMYTGDDPNVCGMPLLTGPSSGFTVDNWNVNLNVEN
eukprot:m.257690 g.257690  ORF g.257690 m.257690 type:complete len:661 (-) comp16191_c1_seq20:124-2106(-)